jgi:hypothetical protein
MDLIVEITDEKILLLLNLLKLEKWGVYNSTTNYRKANKNQERILKKKMNEFLKKMSIPYMKKLIFFYTQQSVHSRLPSCL